jgi:transposase
MKGKQHRPEQIIRYLREADTMIAAGKSIGQVCQALQVSQQTYDRWRNQYGGRQLRPPTDEGGGRPKAVA